MVVVVFVVITVRFLGLGGKRLDLLRKHKHARLDTVILNRIQRKNLLLTESAHRRLRRMLDATEILILRKYGRTLDRPHLRFRSRFHTVQQTILNVEEEVGLRSESRHHMNAIRRSVRKDRLLQRLHFLVVILVIQVGIEVGLQRHLLQFFARKDTRAGHRVHRPPNLAVVSLLHRSHARNRHVKIHLVRRRRINQHVRRHAHRRHIERRFRLTGFVRSNRLFTTHRGDVLRKQIRRRRQIRSRLNLHRAAARCLGHHIR